MITRSSNRVSKAKHSAMQRMTLRKVAFYGIVIFLIFSFFYGWIFPCNGGSKAKMVPKDAVQYTYDSEQKAYPYDRNMPLIFIGGVPRSGTTLMRALLDAHPEVRCGEETRVVPRLLGMRSQWAKSPKESKRLQEAGLSDEVIDSALAAFILEVIAKHGEPAPRLCNKDPFTLKSSVYLSQMFPNAKFVLMIRDGRAVIHSIISRKVTISGFDLKSYRKCLEKWNVAMESMYHQCLRLGSNRCMPVYYEQLVLHPREWMIQILQFLDIVWDEAVLHHEEFINKPGGVSLSRTERSTDQVIKPINLEALTKWVPAIPDDVRQDMAYIAPMLAKLGYDPHAYPPNYGQADQRVYNNTQRIRSNEAFWHKKEMEVQNQSKPAHANRSEHRDERKLNQVQHPDDSPQRDDPQEEENPEKKAKSAEADHVNQNDDGDILGNVNDNGRAYEKNADIVKDHS